MSGDGAEGRHLFKLVLVTYEFTYSPFSGNGILARSIAKALLKLGCHVCVLCCRPSEEAQRTDHHLSTPEISEEAAGRLTLIPLQLAKGDGWCKLDDKSAWDQFAFGNLDEHGRLLLAGCVRDADAVLAIDWTGAHAYKSFAVKDKPLVYMNFRVYSSGVVDEGRRQWFDDMERHALENASVLVVLSQMDRINIQRITSFCSDKIELLLPPLRGDMQELAHTLHTTSEELDTFLPAEVLKAWPGPLTPRKRLLVTCVARISPEKNVFRFLRFVEKAKSALEQLGFIPLLAGASAEESYATALKADLRKIAPEAIILDSFLSPKSLAAVFARTALNFHPCAYDAYGMTLVEAAACGAPSVLAGESVGAWALLGSESLCVDMPPDENELSEDAVVAITSFLRSPELESVGVSAQKKALEWDEQAYGSRLLEVISSVAQ
ncbi:PCMTD1 [Symbiodinium pilosum]|uniref:PCMTD1 protein n=1 Tax=Symbiodinium pilosum TaxID=2952 RepID=A0A812XHN9_SYMPI|nr:PCMTD1 [Symbiodinium pilosum]